MAQKKPETSPVPGMTYLRSVGAAYLSVLVRQASDLEKTWTAIKTGTYGVKDLGSAWTGAIESYFGLMGEVAKGPHHIRRPEWAHFTFSIGNPSTLETTAAIEEQPDGTEIEGSNFTSPAGPVLPATVAAGDASVYTTLLLGADRKTIEIVLDKQRLLKADPGRYMSLVTAKNHSGSPPLLIVTLTIES